MAQKLDYTFSETISEISTPTIFLTLPENHSSLIDDCIESDECDDILQAS